MTALQSIEQTLLAFFSEHAVLAADFNEETDLLSDCEFDSMLVTDVLFHIESTYHIRLAARDVSPENLRTVRRLASLVAVRQQRQNTAA